MDISTLKKLLNNHPDYSFTGHYYTNSNIPGTDSGLAIGVYGPLNGAIRAALGLKWNSTGNKVCDEMVYGIPFSEWDYDGPSDSTD
jgi:hypothetical protein